MNTNDLKPGQLLTPHEAAQLMAVSERTLWQLTKDGKVAAVRLGRCVRYRLGDLLKAQEAHLDTVKGRTEN